MDFSHYISGGDIVGEHTWSPASLSLSLCLSLVHIYTPVQHKHIHSHTHPPTTTPTSTLKHTRSHPHALSHSLKLSHTRSPTVVMAMAAIYWELDNFAKVQQILAQAAEFCSEADVWKLNMAHCLFMQVGCVYVCTVCV